MTVCHKGRGACNELALAEDHDNGGGKWQWVSCNQGWRWRHYNHHHHRHRPHCCHHLLSSPSLSLLTTIVVLINIVVLLIIITGLLLILPATMDLMQPPLMQVATFLACSRQWHWKHDPCAPQSNNLGFSQRNFQHKNHGIQQNIDGHAVSHSLAFLLSSQLLGGRRGPGGKQQDCFSFQVCAQNLSQLPLL